MPKFPPRELRATRLLSARGASLLRKQPSVRLTASKRASRGRRWYVGNPVSARFLRTAVIGLVSLSASQPLVDVC